ncbi:hypothetical protein FNV43_RR21517 [Rhamnella rubrinervis]|uniref:Uncharacterized protein n=1 Tax=Rhamnella rubrinervis TaxID=2594499 RepID=A0A8K0E2F1_9ROSA|nr:hypothetical protein FNV43_RR21517 [Rhamnella rubrinervis]
MVRQRSAPPGRRQWWAAAGIPKIPRRWNFPKGSRAVLGSSCDDGWQCSTEHGTGSHRHIGVGSVGSQCARGSEGMLVARWCYAVCSVLGLSSILRGTLCDGSWDMGCFGLGFENSSVLLGNLSIAVVASMVASLKVPLLMLGNARDAPPIEWMPVGC